MIVLQIGAVWQQFSFMAVQTLGEIVKKNYDVIDARQRARKALHGKREFLLDESRDNHGQMSSYNKNMKPI